MKNVEQLTNLNENGMRTIWGPRARPRAQAHAPGPGPRPKAEGGGDVRVCARVWTILSLSAPA